MLLVAQPGQTCTLAQATNTPTAGSANQNTVQHLTGTYTVNGSVYPARYNPGGAFGPTYGANAVVMDLGAAPVVNTYYVLNNTLIVDQLVSGLLQQPVAANVVQMKAVYGKDTNGDGIVDTWNTVAPVTAGDWASVLAVRLAVVARSANPEKPSNPLTDTCSITVAAPSITWDDGSVTALDVSADPNWMCYRYKVFHFTAGLRNLIWTPVMMRLPPRARPAQRGYILLLVLVALGAMMISGIALVRSMDTSQLMAGNLAARNATLHSADLGVQQAVTWLQAQATTGALNNDAQALGYYAEGVEQAWNAPSFWAACATCTTPDAAGNTVSWVISRMCTTAGNPNAAGNACSTLSGTNAIGGSYSSDAINFTGSPVYFYRITVQVRDSRNTTTLSQAFVTL